MEKEKRDYLPTLLFGLLLAFLTYNYVLKDLRLGGGDYWSHAHTFLHLFTKDTWLQAWMTVPHCLWHLTTLLFNRLLLIPLDSAVAYATCIYTLFAFLVTYWMVQRVTEAAGRADSPARAGFIAFGMCMVQPLYFYWLDGGERYLGPFSMNPIHNPTFMCVKGFSLLCFCLVIDIWGRQKDEAYRGIFFRVENGLRRYYIYLAVLLLLSAIAKPTFAEMFIPAVAFVMLGEWIAKIRRKDGSAKPYFRHCLTTLLCAFPTLLYILLQFLAYFIWGGSYEGEGGSVGFTKWLEVWHLFTENVGLSVALGMAFPLFMILINGIYFLKSDCGRLSLAAYGVGFLEAALLGEQGNKLEHGNFLWPLMSGMLLLFTASMMRLLVLERTEADTKGRRILLSSAWVLFCLHVLYGLLLIWGVS
ncbi:MAG: hypothetical protein NC432_13100 [Roseburia sp.]|nr:hypothetical protein [Roseburia sp.]MCM1098588.1 hypothetical protein [Ruminococcus flavefaciens]